MKKNLNIVLILLFFLTACSAVTTPPLVPTETPQLLELTSTETPTLSPSATPTETPTPSIESLSVTQQSVNEFANAMQNAGINITAEQILQQGLQTQTITGADGKQYEIAFVHLDLDPNKQGETLEGDYPLMIKNDRKWKEFTLSNLVVTSKDNKLQAVGVVVHGDTANSVHDNPKAKDTLWNNFNSAVFEISGWQYREPAEGELFISTTNWEKSMFTMLKNDSQDNMPLEIRHLVWQKQNPDWLKGKSKDELTDILKKYITETMKAYPVNSYVVVNEPAPNEYRWDVFYDALGDDAYIIAFQTAYAQNPEATLTLNDVNNQSSMGQGSEETQRTYNLMKKIRAALPNANLRVGMQMHISAADGQIDEKDIITTIQKMRSLGVEVAFTEVDVRINGINTPDRFQKQAAIYEQLGRIVKQAGVVKVDFWGMTESLNWLELYGINDKKLPDADATLFDDSLGKKLAYYMFIKGYLDAPQ